MKKVFSIFVVLFFTVTSIFAASFKKGAKVYVSVKEAQLKSDEGSFAKTVAKLSYGDVLIVVETNSSKTKVKLSSNQSVTGWVSNGSITSKKIVKTSSGATGASSGELALAGKGFSSEAEKAFRDSQNAASANYPLVDKIEQITVSEKELESFIEEGHLNGGAQ